MEHKPFTVNKGTILPLFDYGATIKLEINYTFIATSGFDFFFHSLFKVDITNIPVMFRIYNILIQID